MLRQFFDDRQLATLTEKIDPAEHMLQAKANMQPAIADPNDDPAAWLKYRDDALRVYHSATTLNPAPANRD